MSAISDYFKQRGAKPVDPAIVAAYERSMQDTIPRIIAAEKASRRAAHFALLGIPDPNRSNR